MYLEGAFRRLACMRRHVGDVPASWRRPTHLRRLYADKYQNHAVTATTAKASRGSGGLWHPENLCLCLSQRAWPAYKKNREKALYQRPMPAHRNEDMAPRASRAIGGCMMRVGLLVKYQSFLAVYLVLLAVRGESTADQHGYGGWRVMPRANLMRRETLARHAKYRGWAEGGRVVPRG